MINSDDLSRHEGHGTNAGNGGATLHDGHRPDNVLSSSDDPDTRYLYRPGQVLVAETSLDEAWKELSLAGAEEIRRVPGFGLRVFETAQPDAVPELVGLLRRAVAGGVSANVVLSLGWHIGCPSPPRPATEAELSGLPTITPQTPQTVDPTTNVRVGSIDTGIVDHPWLEGRVEVRGDEDYDVPVPLGEGEAPHGFAHGTAGAGQIVRKAPNATVVVRRAVLHDGLIDDLALAESLLELGDQGVRVISLAENGYTPGDAGLIATDLVLRRFQLEHPDLVVVAAAGNHGFDRPSFPAASPGVVAVGATDSQGKRAYFSNFGGWIDACAEGVDITVAFPSGKVALPHLAAESFENFAVWSGTSFATPSVVGAIAAKIGAGMTAREAVADLISTADETRRVPGLGTRID